MVLARAASAAWTRHETVLKRLGTHDERRLLSVRTHEASHRRSFLARVRIYEFLATTDLARPMLERTRAFLKEHAQELYIIGAIASSCAVGGFAVGKYIGDTASAAYKAANEMELGALAKAAKKATTELDAAASNFSDLLKNTKTYEEIREQNTSLARQVAELTAERNAILGRHAQLEKSRDALQVVVTRMSKLSSPVQVELNKSIQVGPDLIIGFNRSIPSIPSIVVNDNSRSVQSGSVINTRTERGWCTVRVAEVGDTFAMVTAECPY